MDDRLHHFLHQERQPRNHKELQSTTVTAKADKVFNAQFHKQIKIEIEKILLKNQNGF